MPSHVALLRGINVGKSRRVAMADLRALMTSLGHTDVATYIQSGNVVFTPAAGSDAPADELERAMAETLGVPAAVVVLTRDALARVVRDNPYPDEPNPRFVHAVFFREDPGAALESRVEDAVRRARERGSRDDARVVDGTLFLHTPGGLGRSELAALLTRERAPAVSGTARNWATVTTLLALCDGR